MIEDRAGHSVDYLAENIDRFMDVARRRPELARLNSSLERFECPRCLPMWIVTRR